MTCFVLYLTSMGAYAGFVPSPSHTLDFFTHPQHLRTSPLLDKLRPLSIPIHVYLDSQNESFENEDVSMLTPSEMASYMKHQRALRQSSSTWAIPFAISVSHILWVSIDHHPFSDWIAALTSWAHPMERAIERIALVPLEIGSLFPPDSFQRPSTLIIYEDPAIGHRQIVHVGSLFYLTRLSPHPLSPSERDHMIHETKNYVYNRLHIPPENLSLLTFDRSLSALVRDLVSRKIVFNISPFLEKKVFWGTLARLSRTCGIGLGTLGCVLLLYITWLRQEYAQRLTSYTYLMTQTIPDRGPSTSIDSVEKIARALHTPRPFLPAYMERVIPSLAPLFTIHSCAWTRHSSHETMVLQMSYKKKQAQNGQRKLMSFFETGPCQPQIIFDDASRLYTVTLTKGDS